jgi:hypothetical protein
MLKNYRVSCIATFRSITPTHIHKLVKSFPIRLTQSPKEELYRTEIKEIYFLNRVDK